MADELNIWKNIGKAFPKEEEPIVVLRRVEAKLDSIALSLEAQEQRLAKLEAGGGRAKQRR